jgi:hypothetical protein
MMFTDLLHVIGAISLLGYGIGSLLMPHPIARLIAQQLTTPRGIAEFRIVNGGYFIGLSAFALLVNQPLVYAALGVGWLAAAGARVLALLLDRPKLEPIYLGLFMFEVAMGLFLIA